MKVGGRATRLALAKEFADELLDDVEYKRDLKLRIRAGEAPQLEILLYHYKFGKPTEQLELIDPQDDLENMTNEELAILAQRVQEQLLELSATSAVN